MKQLHTRQLTTAAVVGAAYAALSIFGSVFGITYGPIQCRFSEALCVLPFLFPETAWGLFAGCLIANLLSPYGLLDIVVGSLATLLAALERLKKLIWLAAQDVKAELAGKDVYQHQELAALCGVKPDNWCHNYADYWRAMCAIFKRLDGDSLLCTVRTRSQQKATFSQQGIAKVN